MDHMTLMALLVACAPQVHPVTARALVTVESSMNPHAIGVVGGVLQRQPRHRTEAIAAASALQASGWNFSLGLAQINVHNLRRLNLNVASALEPCANLGAMQTILTECFDRAIASNASHRNQQRALRQALSCYYSGNFTTGFRHGYVERVVASATARPLSPATYKDTP